MTRWSYTHVRFRSIPPFTYILIGIALLVVPYHLYSEITKKEALAVQEYHNRTYELRNFITPQISMDGSSYTLVDGTVLDTTGRKAPTSTALTYLRTATYVTEVRLDPILALPTVDTQNLRLAVKHFDKYLGILGTYFTEEEMALITETLHPTAFLEALPVLEEHRRALIQNPTPQLVSEYNATLVAALKQYRRFTKRAAEATPEVLALAKRREAEVDRKKVASMYYTFPAGRASLDHFRNTLFALHRQASRLLTKEQARMACVEGVLQECSSLSQMFTEATENDKVFLEEDSEQRHGTLPSHTAVIHRLVSQQLDARADLDANTREIEAIQLTENICGLKDTPTYFTSWHAKPWNRETYYDSEISLRYTPLSDLYFYETERGIEQGSTDYFRTVQEYGLPYLHQPLGNTYMCPDNGLVATKLATLMATQEILKAEPIFSALKETDVPTTSQNMIDALREHEREIINREVLSESLVSEYIHNASLLLRKRGEKELAEMYGADFVKNIEQILLLSRAQTAYFEEIVTNIRDINEGLPSIIEDGGLVLIDYFYISRSGYAALLMAFNDTVVPFDISFLSDHERPSLDEYGLYTYHKDLKKMYSNEEILDFLVRTDAFYTR